MNDSGERKPQWRLIWPRRGLNWVQEGAESPSWAELAAWERQLRIDWDSPILVGPEGRVDPRLVEFTTSSWFRRLARGSQESYGIDVRLFFQFLEDRGRAWERALTEDFQDFEHWRRRDESNPSRIAGARWNRGLEAIRMLYEWAAMRGYVSESPVALRQIRLPDGSLVQTPVQKATDVKTSNVKWLTPRAYRLWRDIGLRGYGADGLPEDGWRGRNDGRNVAFADLSLSNGARRRENGSLLVPELPDSSEQRSYYKGWIAAAIAKKRQRYFWVSRPALKEVEAYVISTRADAIRRAQAARRYERLPRRRIVSNIDSHGRAVWTERDGTTASAPINSLGPEERVTLYTEGSSGLEPLSLWLTEGGLPMDYESWDAVFKTASERCERLGIKIWCTPHMLRHSFALHMLVALQHAFDFRLGLTPEERKYYKLIFGDIWAMVRDMLGHQNVDLTRQIYLEPVNGLALDVLLNGLSDGYDDIADVFERIASESGLVIDRTATLVRERLQ